MQPLVVLAPFCLRAPAGTVLKVDIGAPSCLLGGVLGLSPLSPLDQQRTGMSWELWSCCICVGYLVLLKSGCFPAHHSPWAYAIAQPCTHALHLVLPGFTTVFLLLCWTAISPMLSTGNQVIAGIEVHCLVSVPFTQWFIVTRPQLLCAGTADFSNRTR